MHELLAAEWLRLSRWRINQAVLLLLVLAVVWHFWNDANRARNSDLLANDGTDLLRFRALPVEDLDTLSEADKWRWFTAQEVALTLPDSFRVAPWIWTWAQTACLLLVIVAVGNDFQWRTARWLLSLGPGRVRWLLARIAAWLGLALLLTAALWMVVAVAGICVHWRLFGRLDLTWTTAGFWAGQAAAMLRAWIAFWPWIGLGVSMAVVSRSPVAAAALGALVVVLDSLWGYALRVVAVTQAVGGGVNVPRWLTVEGLFGQAYRWTISYNASAVFYWSANRETLTRALDKYGQASPAAGALYILPTHPGQALAVLLAYLLLALGLAAWLLARRDVAR